MQRPVDLNDWLVVQRVVVGLAPRSYLTEQADQIPSLGRQAVDGCVAVGGGVFEEAVVLQLAQAVDQGAGVHGLAGGDGDDAYQGRVAEGSIGKGGEGFDGELRLDKVDSFVDQEQLGQRDSPPPYTSAHPFPKDREEIVLPLQL